MKAKMTLILTGLIALSSTAMADMDFDKNCQKQTQKMVKKIGLTQEQSTQFKELCETTRATYQEQRQIRKAELNKLYDAPTFDAVAAKDLVLKQRENRMIEKMKYRHAINQILTPEQRTMIRERSHKSK